MTLSTVSGQLKQTAGSMALKRKYVKLEGEEYQFRRILDAKKWFFTLQS